MSDHAWYQYYINNVVEHGWRVEPQLWKALPDKAKRMVMEAKREVFKKENPYTESPFANQSKPSSGAPQKKSSGTDSILRTKKSTPTQPQKSIPQPLPNQFSGNHGNVSFLNIGENSINTGTADANVFAVYSGEESSGDSIPIPPKALAKNGIIVFTNLPCK